MREAIDVEKIKQVLQAIERNEHIADALREDVTLINTVLAQDGRALRYVSEECKRDKAFVLGVILRDARAFEYISSELKTDEEFIREVLNHEGIVLQYLSEGLRDNKDIVLRASASSHGIAFRYASDRLKADKETVLAAVTTSGMALRYVDRVLQEDKAFILELMGQNGRALEYIAEALQDDLEIALAAVKQDEMALNYVSASLEDCEEIREVKRLFIDNWKDSFPLQYMHESYRDDINVAEKQVEKVGIDIFKHLSSKLRKVYHWVEKAISTQGSRLQYVGEEQKNSVKDVFLAISNDPDALQYAGELVKGDKMIALQCVCSKGDVLQYTSDRIRNDRNIVRRAIRARDRSGRHAFRHASSALRGDRDFILESVEVDGLLLQYVDEDKQAEIYADGVIIGQAITENGEALQFASEALKGNISTIKRAISSNPKAFQYTDYQFRNYKPNALYMVGFCSDVFRYLSEEMKGDKEVVMLAVNSNGSLLQYASIEMRRDKEVVMLAVRQDGSMLQHVSTEMRGDKEVVMLAVSQDGSLLQHASEEMRGDRDVVTLAVGQCGLALRHVTGDMRKDKQLTVRAIEKNKHVGRFIDESLHGDIDVMSRAVERDGELLRYASEGLRNNIELVMLAVKNCGLSLRFSSEDLQGNHAVVLEAVRNNGGAFRYASQSFRHDKNIVLSMVKKNGEALKYAAPWLWKDREVVHAAVKSKGIVLEYAGEALRNDRELVYSAINQNAFAYRYIGKDFYRDRDMALMAVTMDMRVLQYLSEEMEHQDEFLEQADRILVRRKKIHEANRTKLESQSPLASQIKLISSIVFGSREHYFHHTCDGSEESRLVTAMIHGDYEECDQILSADQVDLANIYRGYSALMVAVFCGHMDIFNRLLREGGSERILNEHILMQAVVLGRPEMVDKIIDCGIDPNVCSFEGGFLYAAAAVGYGCIVDLLIAKGATINNRKTQTKESAIFVAIRNGHYGVVNQLIDAGADTSLSNHAGEGVLRVAIQTRQDTIGALLVARGSFDLASQKLKSIFVESVEYNCWKVFESLLERGMDIETSNVLVRNTTAMIRSPISHNNDRILWLIDRGASVNKKSKTYWSAMHETARQGNVELAEALVERGAWVSEEQYAQESLRKTVIVRENREVFEFFVSRGLFACHMEIKGIPILFYISGEIFIFNRLIELGADVNARYPQDGSTLLIYCVKNGYHGLIDRLIELGIDNIDATDYGGFDALSYAIMRQDLEMVATLAERKKTISEVQKKNLLMIASKANDETILRYLIAKGLVSANLKTIFMRYLVNLRRMEVSSEAVWNTAISLLYEGYIRRGLGLIWSEFFTNTDMSSEISRSVEEVIEKEIGSVRNLEELDITRSRSQYDLLMNFELSGRLGFTCEFLSGVKTYHRGLCPLLEGPVGIPVTIKGDSSNHVFDLSAAILWLLFRRSNPVTDEIIVKIALLKMSQLTELMDEILSNILSFDGFVKPFRVIQRALNTGVLSWNAFKAKKDAGQFVRSLSIMPRRYEGRFGVERAAVHPPKDSQCKSFAQ